MDTNNLSDSVTESDDLLQSARQENRRLQDQVKQLKRQVKEAEDELRRLKEPPQIVGYVEQMIGDNVVVRQSGNNQEFKTENPQNIDVEVGDLVGLHKNTRAITEKINGSSEYDGRTEAMVIEENPDVSFEDIGGLEEELEAVRETAEQPIKKSDLIDTVGVEPPTGVLMHGPPGTGKTLTARAVANETDSTFIKLAGSELARKFVGEGSRLVRSLFEIAKEKSPSIIFIDEIDAIAEKRSSESKGSGSEEVHRTLMQLLSEMDGFENRSSVRIMGATNRRDRLDDAIVRPGRFDRIVEFGTPDESAREQIFKVHADGLNTSDKIDFTELARRTDGMTGAEIESICTEAGMNAVRENRETVEMRDFNEAIDDVVDDTTVSFSSTRRGFQ